jgi:hypothetical protein
MKSTCPDLNLPASQCRNKHCIFFSSLYITGRHEFASRSKPIMHPGQSSLLRCYTQASRLAGPSLAPDRALLPRPSYKELPPHGCHGA